MLGLPLSTLYPPAPRLSYPAAAGRRWAPLGAAGRGNLNIIPCLAMPLKRYLRSEHGVPFAGDAQVLDAPVFERGSLGLVEGVFAVEVGQVFG